MIGSSEDWEPDAEYFLLYNIYMMLIAPMKRRYGNKVYFQQVRIDMGEYGNSEDDASIYFDDALRHDVKLIRKHAEEISRRRDKPYISSTTAAIALGEVAEKLKTGSFQVWGPRPRRNGEFD